MKGVDKTHLLEIRNLVGEPEKKKSGRKTLGKQAGAVTTEPEWWSIFTRQTSAPLIRAGLKSLEEVAEALSSGDIQRETDRIYNYKGQRLWGFGKKSYKEVCELAGGKESPVLGRSVFSKNTAERLRQAGVLWLSVFSKNTAERLRQAGFKTKDQLAKALRSGKINRGPRDSGIYVNGTLSQDLDEKAYQEICKKLLTNSYTDKKTQGVQVLWGIFSSRTAKCLRQAGFEGLEEVTEALRSGQFEKVNASHYLYKGSTIQGFGARSYLEICKVTNIWPSKKEG